MAMVILGVLLLVLKIAAVGPVANWSMWVVLAPFGLAFLWWAWSDASGWTKKREIDKLDERVRERRRKNLEALGFDVKSQRRR